MRPRTAVLTRLSLVITDPENPKFDLEALLLAKEKELS